VETRTFLIRTAFDDNDNDIMIEEKYISLSYSVILSIPINNEKENKHDINSSLLSFRLYMYLGLFSCHRQQQQSVIISLLSVLDTLSIHVAEHT